MTQQQTKYKQTEIWMIPEDWEVTIIYDLAEWINWMTFKNINFSKNWIPVIKINELKNWITSQTQFSEWEYSNKYKLKRNDILFSWSWSPDTSIDAFYYQYNEWWLNQHIFKLNINKNISRPYFYYLLKFSKQRFIDIAKDKQTTGLWHVTIWNLKNFLIPLPPLPEQVAIAEILSSLDDKIELLEKQNKTLENIWQSLFKSWFVDFEPFSDDLVESEMGMIPRGWKVGKVGDLVDFIVDNRWKTPETVEPNEFDFIPLIEINALIWTWRCVNVNLAKKWVTNEVYETWFRKWHPERWDILFSTVWSIWEMALIFDEKICIAQNIVSLRPKIGWEFVYELLNYIKPNLLWLDISTVQPSIKLPHLLNFEILIPNMEIVMNFIEKTKDASDKIYKNKTQIQTLSGLRDSLLPRLMSGKIRCV